MVRYRIPENNHIIAANEGNAVAIAAGYYLGKDQNCYIVDNPIPDMKQPNIPT